MRNIMIRNDYLANLKVKAKRELEDILESCALEGFQCPKAEFTWDDITEADVLIAVAKIRGQTVKQIQAKNRKREFVYSRFLYSVFCLMVLKKVKGKLDITLGSIGQLIGKDHATILHYKQDYTDILDLYKEYPTISNKIRKDKVERDLKKVEKHIDSKIINR